MKMLTWKENYEIEYDSNNVLLEITQELKQGNKALKRHLKDLNKYYEKEKRTRISQTLKLVSQIKEEYEKKIKTLTEKISKLSSKLDQEKARIQTLRKINFGSSSEKKPKENSTSNTKSSRTKRKNRKKGKQKGTRGFPRRIRKELKLEERFLNLEPNETLCQTCRKPYALSHKTDDSEQVERRVVCVRVLIKRRRYIRQCHCEDPPKFKVAPKSAKLIPKGMLSENLIAWLLYLHYALQVPWNRVIQMLKMEGLELGQGMLTGILKKMGPVFNPLYRDILKKAQGSPHWHMDETSWRMFGDSSRKRCGLFPQQKAWLSF